MKDRVFATILQGTIESFIDACAFRFNDLELFNRYTTTVKVQQSDKSEVTCSEGVQKLLPKLIEARKDYLLAKENSNTSDLNTKKETLTKVYSDLYTVSEKIVEIVGKDKFANKANALTDITSSGDTTIRAKNNVTISGDSITLKANSIKLQAEGLDGITIDADYALALKTVSSSIELNPRKIAMGVRRCYITDLPFDSSMTIGQGINLSAVNVKIKSLVSASMTDSFGASVKASKGKASLTGTEYSTKAISAMQALGSLLKLGNELKDFINLIPAKNKSDDEDEYSTAKKAVTTIQSVTDFALAGYDSYDDLKAVWAHFFDKQKDIENSANEARSGSNPKVNTVDIILVVLDILSMLFDIIEANLLVYSRKSKAESYKNRVKKAGYMSPQDWIKLAFYLTKASIVSIVAFVKTFVYFKDNKGKENMSDTTGTPDGVTVESPAVTTNNTTSSSNAGPMMGSGAPAVNTGETISNSNPGDSSSGA
ncbi:MAG: hypothetical protein ACI4NE_04900 [Succinivibrio sp.]